MMKRSIVRISVGVSTPDSSRSACRGRKPPLPPTNRFHPSSAAITPMSLPCASAHPLARRANAPVAQLKFDRERDRVLHAVAAPGRADAGFHRREGLAVGVPGLEAGVDEPPPDRGQLLDPGAEQVDPLPAGDLGV